MKQRKDPVTGDVLSASEYVSWMIQRVMRNFAFLGVITAITAYVWIVADPIWRHPVTDQWNLWASYLAIIIEGVTAMALINQTRRDAVVIREVRAIAERIAATEEHEDAEIQATERRLLEEDQRMETIMAHLDQQDTLILKIVQLQEKQHQEMLAKLADLVERERPIEIGSPLPTPMVKKPRKLKGTFLDDE